MEWLWRLVGVDPGDEKDVTYEGGESYKRIHERRLPSQSPTEREIEPIVGDACHSDVSDSSSRIVAIDSSHHHNAPTEARGGDAVLLRLADLRPFFRFIWLIATNYSKDDIEFVMMYFLVAQTQYQCNFLVAYGGIYICAMVVQVVLLPFLSWLTDHTARHAPTVFLCSVLVEFSIEGAMICTALWSWNGRVPIDYHWLMFLHVSRQTAHAQSYNGLWKVFKIRLQDRMGGRECAGQQEKVLNIIGMCGIGLEVLLDSIVFVGGYLLLSAAIHSTSAATSSSSFFSSHLSLVSALLSFQSIGLVICGVSISLTLINAFMVLSLVFSQGTTSNTTPPRGATLSSSSSPLSSRRSTTSINATTRTTTKSSLPSSSDYSSASSSSKPPPQTPPPPSSSSSSRVFGLAREAIRYFTGGIAHLYDDVITRNCLLSSVVLFLSWETYSQAEPLVLANTATGEHPTLDNYCGDMFVSLMLQSVYQYLMYFVGALIYLCIFLRVTNYRFFSLIYPVSMVLFTLCTITLYLPSKMVPMTARTVLVSIVAVVPWFYFVYLSFLLTATVDKDYSGLLSSVLNYLPSATSLLPSLLLYLSLNRAVGVVCIVLFLLAAAHSMYCAVRYRTQLKDLN
eukprot:TRINITY_DN4281_c0_g1_i1.p1 TRINITY_DN4281_c0_g1~~TRINITY_DN4281_c0_g1_i1.p1  ORF type:complete len:623 (+),score=132.62 TRINITY_DN4281_c0_g1_i1:114-1982(+)